MKEVLIEQLNERLFFEKMDNGLDVYILPKKEFFQTFAVFATKYGSVDNHFVPLGKEEPVRVPDGIAHFLEHKMFEKKTGDVLQAFTRRGASANAYTTFTRTAYLFSSADRVKENLRTLLDFVQEPYFTDQSVEKEKGIIGQEIQMYNDQPDWRAYFGTIENMYHHHPVKIDIAGTLESITRITKELLYECYRTFYHPANMAVFVDGPVDPGETLALIRENQGKKSFARPEEIRRIDPDEPEGVATKFRKMEMNVQTPKCMVGIKGRDEGKTGDEALREELAVELLLEMLFGKSSPHREGLYNEDLITDRFYFDYSRESGFAFAVIGGDTKHPDRLNERIREILFGAKAGTGLEEAGLVRIKKKKIGEFLRAFNSPEFIANQFIKYRFNGIDLFRVLPVLETIGYQDVIRAAERLISEDRITCFQIVPKG
ncbi:EF-P 5-aminopentanol modification-associated protein YfmH [Caldibacillus debilis]|uniref:EF-P 5-aminopentanol modification-associated protein YfmH n=1 Tax=Caldibacillus debilis TaxID=301148 RepID=UPI0003666904|nr:pitrilysin family protein [Caldibacillus debilis]